MTNDTFTEVSASPLNLSSSNAEALLPLIGSAHAAVAAAFHLLLLLGQVLTS